MSAADVVNRFIEAIERKDVDAAVALTADTISYENMPISPIVGRDGLAATLRAFLDPAVEVDWKILRQLEVGPVVVNERLDRFRIGDGWIELPVAGVFEIDGNGQITLWRDYFDMGSYQRQMAKVTGA
jgi:limonene-1,2-epoxide hydrolase